MCPGINQKHHVASDLLTDPDNGFEMLVADHFRELLGSEATLERLPKPFFGNGHTRFDPVSSQTLVEFAWFYDPVRIDHVPLWDTDAMKKMRTPLVGFSHYRVTPATIPMLFDFAWFQNGLFNNEIE
jgi:hypothetical protein